MSKSNITWITGAGTGIGRAISKKFVENNSHVAASSRKETQLKRLKSELEESDLFASKEELFHVFPVDLMEAEDVEKTAKNIYRKFDINCLINNAGITSFARADENSLSETNEIINTNLTGAIFAIQSVLPIMIKNKKGIIINILSVAARKIFEQSSVYAASKAGLLAYTNVLREELREHNIKVVNILPGATKTPIWPNSVLEKVSEKMMSPDDVANIVFDIHENNSSAVIEEITLRPISGDL